MKYICQCGKESISHFENFIQGKRCRSCSGKEKKTIEFIKEEFAKRGFELISNIYVNCKEKLQYKCKCGIINQISFDG